MRYRLVTAVMALTAFVAFAPGVAVARQHPRAIPHKSAPFGKSFKPAGCASQPGAKTNAPARASQSTAAKAHCFALVLTTSANSTAISSTPSGYGPVDLQTAYNLTNLSATAGSGQTVAIVDAGGDITAASDLATYRTTYGLSPANLRIVNQTGGSTLPPSQGWEDEISLDLDMVSAIAPNAKLLLVEGNTASFTDLGTAVNTAVAMGATQVSNSYGADEVYGAPYSSYYNHPGVAITASTGDGAFGCSDYWQPCFPASAQTVEAVGGTSLTSVSPRIESVWGPAASNPYWGTGSGCSQQFAKPSWQADTGCAMRSVGDVSADADPYTGVAVMLQGSWYIYGGTSASSPIIASVDALLGSSASSASFYYRNASRLNDVTSGSNDLPGSPCMATFPYLCTAGLGYDGPTGVGTPNGAALVQPPASPPTASITSPAAGAVFTQDSAVIANYSCTEGANGPGIGTCVGPVQSGQAIDTSTLGAHTFAVVAKSSDGQTGSAVVAYTVNAPPPPPPASPTASIASPANGAKVAQGQLLRASYSCTEGARGPGILSCFGPVADGAAINTSTAGAHTFTVVATSSDGKTGSISATYTVTARIATDVVPKAPKITAHPAKSTRSRSATFKFTDATAHASYKCRLDGAQFKDCKSGIKRSNLSRKTHTFRVEAILNGRTSKFTSFTWKIHK